MPNRRPISANVSPWLRSSRPGGGSRAIWREVDAYCAKIGFDIRRPDTWKRPKAGQPRLELAKSATVLALAAMVALHMRCSVVETAKGLLCGAGRVPTASAGGSDSHFSKNGRRRGERR
jgi:hypothetical protein